MSNTDKLSRDRVHASSRSHTFDEPLHEQTSSVKHSSSSLSRTTSKSSRAPSNDYVRLNPPEPPEPANLAKKKSKDKAVDKVNDSYSPTNQKKHSKQTNKNLFNP